MAKDWTAHRLATQTWLGFCAADNYNQQIPFDDRAATDAEEILNHPEIREGIDLPVKLAG